MHYKIKKGLDVPIAGEPSRDIDEASACEHVALTAYEHLGLKPRLSVEVGDKVRRGQCLFTHKQDETPFLSPAGGVVKAIHRGERRALQSIVIRVDESDERAVVCDAVAPENIGGLAREAVVEQVVRGGLWPVFKTRPFSKMPDPQSVPHAIFVTAMDTRPLAAAAGMLIAESSQAFQSGLEIVAHISGGTVYVCHSPMDELPQVSSERVQYAQFEGPHPAGLPGTHIHYIEPLMDDKVVWTINYADVIALGELFLSGEYPIRRTIALAGPSVLKPRLLRARLGASVSELCAGELREGDCRMVVGSVMDGVAAREGTDFLHRFATQVSVLPLHMERSLMAWVRPGLDLYSVSNTLLSKLNAKRKFAFNCAYNGSARNLIPLGLYERVYPLTPLATQLLKALLVGDTDTARQLGCMELDEEDLAVCSYVCPSKHDFGPVLRSNLNQIEKEF